MFGFRKLMPLAALLSVMLIAAACGSSEEAAAPARAKHAGGGAGGGGARPVSARGAGVRGEGGSVVEGGLNQSDRKVGTVQVVEIDHVWSLFLQKKIELPSPLSVSHSID